MYVMFKAQNCRALLCPNFVLQDGPAAIAVDLLFAFALSSCHMQARPAAVAVALVL